MIVYQLMAKGPLAYFSGSGKIHSKNVYLTKEKAEEKVEEFKVTCCKTDDKLSSFSSLASIFSSLASIDSVTVLELELNLDGYTLVPNNS